MAFQGITFDGQNVSPKNDGALYGAHYGDGILDGCTMTISGDDLVIASGHFIAGGRVCQVDGATSVDLSGRTLQTGYIQVIMNYDLTQGEGSQWYTTFVESATTTFPALTQDDINDNGSLYQVALAVIQISGGNLTSITSSIERSAVVFINDNGEIQGKIRLTASNFVMSGKEDNDGLVTAGLRVGTETIIVGADNQPISFRPHGMYDSTNSLYIDPTDGQLYSINGGCMPRTGNSNYGTKTFSYGGNSNQTLRCYRWGRFAQVSASFGGNTFSSVSADTTIATLDDIYRPDTEVYLIASARTSGAWASATYYPFVIYISTGGEVHIRGNQTQLRSCNYLSFCGTYVCKYVSGY